MRDGGRLRNALRAEGVKLRTAAGSGWLLLGLIAVTVAASGLASAIEKCAAACPADPARISLTGVQAGQAIVVILAAGSVTGEYGTGMIGLTLAAMPRRVVVLGAKAAVLAGVVAAGGAVAVLGSVLAGRVLLPGNGFTGADGDPVLAAASGAMLRAAGGSVLYLVLIALLSLGAAAALRDTALAVTAVLGLLYVVPVIGSVVLDQAWQVRIERYAPTAGLAVQGTRNLARLPIGPWAGLGVLALWAAGALIAGGIALVVRDA